MLTRQFLSVKEVAELFKVGEATVRHWIKDGSLRAINVGREWRIAPKDLESFLQAHANRPPDAPDPSCDGSAGDAILPRDKPR
jgi:excisionase family DNA binding protein